VSAAEGALATLVEHRLVVGIGIDLALLRSQYLSLYEPIPQLKKTTVVASCCKHLFYSIETSIHGLYGARSTLCRVCVP
jgi:hypothetical protein